MIRTKLLSWISIAIYTLTFFLAITIWVPPAQADCAFLIFFCSDNKSSFQSKGGVRRGPCADDELGLIAFAPKTKSKSALALKGVGSTAEDYPTLWFYLPPYNLPAYKIKSAKFVLLDENRHFVQDPIYAQLPQVSKGVIAGLTLPRQGKALEVGKQYSWYFSIMCDFQKPSRNPEVTGQIQRVLPGPLPRVPEPDYIVHDSTYAGHADEQNIVFYDTLTQLVKKHSNYSFDWNNLLSKSEIPSAEKSSVRTAELRILDKPPEECNSSSNAVQKNV